MAHHESKSRRQRHEQPKFLRWPQKALINASKQKNSMRATPSLSRSSVHLQSTPFRTSSIGRIQCTTNNGDHPLRSAPLLSLTTSRCSAEWYWFIENFKTSPFDSKPSLGELPLLRAALGSGGSISLECIPHRTSAKPQNFLPISDTVKSRFFG